jgi:ribosomal protein S18 acetylase RimI-like enzyme
MFLSLTGWRETITASVPVLDCVATLSNTTSPDGGVTQHVDAAEVRELGHAKEPRPYRVIRRDESVTMPRHNLFEPGGTIMATTNELAISTAPEIWLWAFRGDRNARESCFSAWWDSDDSMFSHRLSRVISEGGEPVGLELGYTHAEKASAVEATVAIAAKVLQPAAREHLLSAFLWLTYLCPPIPDRAYYVQWLATDRHIQGRGLGKQLLTEAFVRSRSNGFLEVQLDVKSTNPAVGFYTHLGMQILSESRVPFLEQYDIPAHYRMVKYL